MRAHETIGVFSQRKLHDEGDATGLTERIDRFGRGVRTGSVGVEADEDALRVLAQFGRLIARERRTERRDGVRESRLVQRDAIEIAIDDDERFARRCRAASDVEGVEAAALGVDGGRARIEIFRLLVVERAAAEGYDLARGGVGRDHEPAAIEIVVSALARLDEICLLGDGEIDPARLKFGDERAPIVRRVAEFEGVDGRGLKAALGDVGSRDLALRCELEDALIERGSGGVRGVDLFSLGRPDVERAVSKGKGPRQRVCRLQNVARSSSYYKSRERLVVIDEFLRNVSNT